MVVYACNCGWSGIPIFHTVQTEENDCDREPVCAKCGSIALDVIDKQKNLTKEFYMNGMDFKDWIRYYYLVKTAIRLKPMNVLEIGIGNGIVKNCIKDHCLYWAMDINLKLEPNIIGDIRDYQEILKGRFDLIVASEVLEHIPFIQTTQALLNLYRYLKVGGTLLITVPHHKPYIMTSTIASVEPKTVSFPKFRNFEITDEYHEWEIGKYTSVQDMEWKLGGCGFTIVKREHIPWHEFWEVRK
jgi:predicted SAM-dependent methyltransferase